MLNQFITTQFFCSNYIYEISVLSASTNHVLGIGLFMLMNVQYIPGNAATDGVINGMLNLNACYCVKLEGKRQAK
jgi:hypothetical protein